MKLKKYLASVAVGIALLGAGTLSANAAKGDLGTDVSKFQPVLENATGQDKFSFAQMGGSIDGWIYDQYTYSDQIYQGQNSGYRMHNYIWLETGSNQEQSKEALDYFLTKVKTPYGSNVALDVEEGASDDVEANTQNILFAMKYVQEAGFNPLLYSYKPYLNAHVNVQEILNEFPNSLWVAGYQNGDEVTPDYSAFPSMDGIAMWQYSSSNNWDKNVDLLGVTDNGYTQNTNVTPTNQPAVTPQPVQPTVTTETNSAQGTYYVSDEQNVRTSAGLNGSVTGQLDSGDSIIYDSTAQADGYTWYHYINYSGQDRWVADLGSQNVQSNGLTEYYYTVEDGDTLYGISNYLGEKMDTTIANNDIVNPDTIYPGQVLVYYR